MLSRCPRPPSAIGNRVLPVAESLRFTVLVVPAQTVLALLLAQRTNGPGWANRSLRLTVLIPTMISLTVLSVLWKLLYEPVSATGSGLFNGLLTSLHLPPQPFLTSTRQATYWRVALPNAKTAITTVILLDFIVHRNDFLWPLVICQATNTRTVQLGLGNFFTQPSISWGAIMAYAVLATIPMMLILGVGQKRIAQSLVTTGIRE